MLPADRKWADLMDNYDFLISGLNDDDVKVRLESLEKLMEEIRCGKMVRPEAGIDVNNHIHTFYSFSPYSPSKAVWTAYQSGLQTAGIMDHDSVSGAAEFIEAGKITGLAVTVGMECRTDFSKTPLAGHKINHPDQVSTAYAALHGIPHTSLNKIAGFMSGYARERGKRNRRIVENINQIFLPYGITIDYDADIIPLSKSREGGSITERHILYALAKRLTENFGRGEKLVRFLKDKINLKIPPKLEANLLDAGHGYYEYDLLGVFKGDFTARFYIPAAAECPDIREFLEFSKSIGAISAYAYLGDVGDSVTGDKVSQKFEDDYLDLLFEVISGLGFDAVTYMPTRNTLEQIRRVKTLCERYGLFQISGEDINNPRQTFICNALRQAEFRNLIDSTWALIGHEKSATEDIRKGMFSLRTVSKVPDLNERIQIYKKIGMAGR